MPYITEDKRSYMDRVVRAMVEAEVKVDGDLNYILYKFCKYHIKPSYKNYRDFRAELIEAAEEIRRRLLVPYEEKKIKENGDI